MFKSFLAALGRGLAHVGVAIVKGSVYVSTDPQVVQIVAGLAGHPEIGAAVIAGATAVATGAKVVADVKAGDAGSAVADGKQTVAGVKGVILDVQSLKK